MAGIDELFTRRLPVLLKSQDKEDRKTNIHVTVEVHTASTPVHRKELVVRLTNEQDLFFLYTLRLTEEEFQSLKMQQGLLVDFGAFPQKFIDLLELCLQEEHKDIPKFILHLLSNGTEGTSTANLNVIETNPFKHLTHLSLKFLPGTDTDVKKYLAGCLKNFKDQNVTLMQRLEHTESDLSQQLRQAREALASRTQELDGLRTEWNARTSQLTSKHAQEVNSEKERALHTQSSVQQRYEREKRELEQNHVKIVKQMEVKLYDLENANKELTDRKYKSESTIRETRSKLSLLEDEHHRAKQEVTSLRKDNAALDANYHEQEKVLNQLKTRLAVVEQEVKDKEEVMSKTSDLLGTEQSQKRKYEDEIDRKKRHVNKLESSIKKMSEELIKGNEIIKKLQGEIKNYHSKLKLRSQVTTEQEKLLGEKTREMEEVRRELESTKTSLRQKEEENKKLNESLETTMQKLEESRQLLKTNENVINWLNKQVTDMQLTGAPRGHGAFEMTSGSTNSFKPTSRAPLHNYSAPSMGYSQVSRMSTPTMGDSPVSTVTSRPQVHYNPGQPPKASALPVPLAKSSPIGTIPEERRREDVQASPSLSAKTSRASEPFLDSKYLQHGEVPRSRPGLGMSVGAGPGTAHPANGGGGGGGGGGGHTHPGGPYRTVSPAPVSLHFGPQPSAAASSYNPTRLSRDLIIPRAGPAPTAALTTGGTRPVTRPPLASAYFPGGAAVS